MTKTERDLTDGRRQQEAGEFAKAEAIFNRVLKREPANVHAKFFLGAMKTQMGQHDESVRLLSEVVDARPDWEEAHNNLAVALQQAGRITDAIKHYEKAIELNPDFVEPYSNISYGLQLSNRYDYALEMLDKAIALDSNRRDSWVNKGHVLTALDRKEEARIAATKGLELLGTEIESIKEVAALLIKLEMWEETVHLFETCIELYPDYASGYNMLASAIERTMTPFNRNEGLKRMLELIDKSVEIDPEFLDGLVNRANILHKLRRTPEAMAVYDSILDRIQDRFDGMNNYGAILQDVHDYEGAIDCCRRAIAIEGKYAEPYYNWGSCLHRQGRLEEARVKYIEALERNPDHIDSHSALSLLYLTLGRYEEGWKEYEWRKQTDQFSGRLLDMNWLDPQKMAGQRILLHAEQGQGDMFQFIRYADVIKAAGAQAFVECHDGLRELIETCPWVDEVRERSDAANLVFDQQANLLSLPFIFKTDLESVPSQVPYLSAPASYRPKWSARIAELTPEGTRLKVGIVWAGNPDHFNDAQRSTTLEKFGALANIPGVTFFSVQKGEKPEAQLDNPPAGMTIIPLGAEIKSFSDTAAILENLDLVIAVDTSVAHLAGAMGIPVWMLLPYANDFRWLTDRDDSPWYPTMRLFRQRALWDYDYVFEKVAIELERYAADPVQWSVDDAIYKFDNGDRSNAKVQLLALTSRFGSDARLINAIGELMWSDGNTQEALQMFVAALQLDPSNRRSIANCAHVLDAFGQRSDAQALYRNYMDAHPDDTDFAEALSGLADERQLAAA